MSLQLHETVMGRKLIEHTLPEIAEQLKRIADSLENKPSQDTLEVGVYYYINEETGKKVYDIEEMYQELDQKISNLEKQNQ